MPARSAAQNGWMKTFALHAAKLRRRIAPAAALPKTTIVARRCSTPNITASAAAPIPAARAKSQVGEGGDCEIALIAFIAESGASRPASTSSTALIEAATRSMSTPVGSADTSDMSKASLSSSSCSSPQRGITLQRTPSDRPRRSAADTVCSVACPLT